MADETESANPLPLDAEHGPAPIESHVSDSNPLPSQESMQAQNVVITDPADSNPLPESQSQKAVSAAQDDSLIPAVGYFVPIVALIGLVGQNNKAKFHGMQSLLYWLFVGVLYLPVLILTGVLGISGLGLVATLLFVVYLLGFIIVVPLYLAFRTHQGQDVRLPVIGNFVAEKVGYNPR